MSKHICKNCKHWHHISNFCEDGNCRINPPIRTSYDSTTVWPKTKHDDFCGEFEKSGVLEPQSCLKIEEVCPTCNKTTHLLWKNPLNPVKYGGCLDCMSMWVIEDPPKEEPKEKYTLYECPNCSKHESVYGSYNEDTWICNHCGKEYGFVSWEKVSNE